tara:strand:+ start:99 stop:998 length:900 start_codon:yes stop_codon:yes gene_type:complete
MAYGIQSPNQQRIESVSRTQNKNQYDAFYFTDIHNLTNLTYQEGGVFTTQGVGTLGFNTSALQPMPLFWNSNYVNSQTKGSGVVQLSTQAGTNSTNHFSLNLGYNTASYNLLCGIQTPSSSSLVSKYEIEGSVYTPNSPFSSGTTTGGYYRCGFMDSPANAIVRGLYFEYLQDGTTLDTTWFVTLKSLSNGSERTNTGVTVAINTIYRLYLSLEAFTGGTYTITYKIRAEDTSGNVTNTEGTITPTTNRVPTATTDTMSATISIGRATNSTAAVRVLNVDYMGVRIRKPISREILLGTL